jgi:hypothetical protein
MRTAAMYKKSESGIVESKENNSVYIKTDFKALDHRIIDSKSRVTLSQTWLKQDAARPVQSFKVYRNGDGDLLLRPEVTVPAREAWVYENPKILASLQRGIKDIEEGRGEVVKDLGSFLDKL